ncbi:MAG TPA: nucleoside-diphosphate sugar epimerase [Ramlibacter sp.]
MTSSPGETSAPAAASGRSVLLAGGSGLVGRELLQFLLADPSVAAVHALGRRDLPLRQAALIQHRADFAALPALPRVDEAYVALGTTIRVAGSRAAFRAVDHDAVVAVAKAARAAGATRLGVVSAMGADARSRVFYNRVKGEMEQAVGALGFGTLVIARPSLLVGDRAALGQPVRSGEEIGLKASRWLAPLIPANYRPIAAAAVARALVRAVRETAGQRVLLSGQMQER